MTTSGHRVAVVTGSSRGIGAAAAVELGRLEYRVIVNYLSNVGAAHTVVKTIEAAGGTAKAVKADVRDAAQSAHLIDTAAAEFGRVDVLVANANAGRLTVAALVDLPWGDFHRRITDELAAIYHVTKAALPLMRAQCHGRVIYISSDLSEGPISPGMITVGVGKAAMNCFAKYVACEEGPHQITVNVVSPGLVMTEEAYGLPPDFVARLADGTPLGRNAEPADIGSVIALVASQEAGFVTGAVIPANGGFGVARR